jgi:uncharacterized protein YeaO (DUF488 family)
MIKAKRWIDPVEPSDGHRLLVCRYRPRALPKADETWDAWDPQLGPSRELHAEWYKVGMTFAEFKRRYLAEMKSQAERIDALARRVAGGETITLLCSKACTDAERCHRMLLKGLIEKRLKELRDGHT